MKLYTNSVLVPGYQMVYNGMSMSMFTSPTMAELVELLGLLGFEVHAAFTNTTDPT